jgi:hypothetical protein
MLAGQESSRQVFSVLSERSKILQNTGAELLALELQVIADRLPVDRLRGIPIGNLIWLELTGRN